MDEIKILFYVLATFLGGEETYIAAEKATVVIDPVAKTITIGQEDLFTVVMETRDHLKVIDKLTEVTENTGWREELAEYPTVSCELYEGANGALHANLLLEYRSDEDLKDYGLTYHEEGYFSFTNFPQDNLRTDDGKLHGNYWHFDATRAFKFSLEPSDTMPDEVKVLKMRLLDVWREIKSK